MASEAVVGLYYFVNTEKAMIWSLTKKQWLSYDAVSGGGRGVFDIKHHITDPYGEHLERWLGDRDYHQREDAKHGIRGGPLPPGQYFVGQPAHHPHLGYSSLLQPDTATKALLHELHRGKFVAPKHPHCGQER